MPSHGGMVGVVRLTALARLVVLVGLIGAPPQGGAFAQGAPLCGRCPNADAAVSVIAARHGTVESLALRESARINVTTRSGHSGAAVLTASVRLTAVGRAGACTHRRRAAGLSVVCSPAALRGPPASI
jgi:hypothetical protein